jgi:predicted ATPase
MNGLRRGKGSGLNVAITDENLLHDVRIHAKKSEDDGWYVRAGLMWELADRYEALLKKEQPDNDFLAFIPCDRCPCPADCKHNDDCARS